MAELDEILSGQDPVETPETPAERPRDENGRWVAAEQSAEETVPTETAVPPTAPEAPVVPKEEPQEDRVPQAALLDERRKRQERDRENDDLRRQLEELRKPKTEKAEETSLWDDPEARLALAEKRAEERALATILNREANKSERQARKKWTDYDERRALFEERLNSDPVLLSAFQREVIQGDEDLGEFVYETVEKIRQFDKVRDPNYAKTLEAEIRAKVLAEMQKSPPVPQSLNSTASPSNTTEQWAGPPPLDDILKRK